MPNKKPQSGKPLQKQSTVISRGDDAIHTGKEVYLGYLD